MTELQLLVAGVLAAFLATHLIAVLIGAAIARATSAGAVQCDAVACRTEPPIFTAAWLTSSSRSTSKCSEAMTELQLLIAGCPRGRQGSPLHPHRRAYRRCHRSREKRRNCGHPHPRAPQAPLALQSLHQGP